MSSYFGAQAVPAVRLHERARAVQRVFVCGIVGFIWCVESWLGRFTHAKDYAALGFTILYVTASLLNRSRGDFHSQASLTFL